MSYRVLVCCDAFVFLDAPSLLSVLGGLAAAAPQHLFLLVRFFFRIWRSNPKADVDLISPFPVYVLSVCRERI